MVDVRYQHFVIARFADYCAYSRPYPDGVRDPVQWLWTKLSELEDPIYALKQDLLDGHLKRFAAKAMTGITEAETADFKSVLESYVAPGDFADAAYHLMDPGGLKDLTRLKAAVECFKKLRAARLLDDEHKPPEAQGALYKKLVGELYKRLSFDRLEEVKRRKPLTVRRMRMLLRRCRFETANYAAVFRFPKTPEDTFTPFILPRVEALVAANRKFLRVMRTR